MCIVSLYITKAKKNIHSIILLDKRVMLKNVKMQNT